MILLIGKPEQIITFLIYIHSLQQFFYQFIYFYVIIYINLDTFLLPIL